ncbi:hypothetical protein [Mesorhizobium sp.]|uniref:hypothetical protein n=1 Tax=Mesorhizobium sp. TaxID=1871066 RepID=UPI0025F6C137|nr:hypothetical protein [Mesorhizobium sp.]
MSAASLAGSISTKRYAASTRHRRARILLQSAVFSASNSSVRSSASLVRLMRSLASAIARPCGSMVFIMIH